MKRRRNSGLVWTLPVIGLALAVVVVIAVVRPRGSAVKPAPVPAGVLSDLTAIPAATWDRVGAGQAPTAARPPVLVAAPAAAQRPVSVLYVGAEYCPFCAAERWPLIAALARFGRFSGLEYTTSSATDVYPSTPTFTFIHARYDSPYVRLQTVELQGNVQQPNGQYPALQTMTPQQQAVVQKYDAPPYVQSDQAGSIPFLMVGGRYLWVGTSYSPQYLKGQDWPAIARSLPPGGGKGTAAGAILANGNAIAAAICAADGGQPAAVCGSAGVSAAARLLPTRPVR
jgi:hypothetical protein